MAPVSAVLGLVHHASRALQCHSVVLAPALGTHLARRPPEDHGTRYLYLSRYLGLLSSHLLVPQSPRIQNLRLSPSVLGHMRNHCLSAGSNASITRLPQTREGSQAYSSTTE